MQRSADDADGETVPAKNRVTHARKMMVKGSEQSRILQTGLEANDLAREITASFNDLRAQLTEFLPFMKESQEKTRDFVGVARAVSCGDYSLLLGAEDGADVEDPVVEDAGLFEAKLVEVAQITDFAKRMRACCRLNAKIAGAIEGWKSKVAKMKERTTLNGASEAEIEVARTKIAQFNEVISILRKRGGKVTELYFDTKREVTGFLAQMERLFKVINHQESPGKVNLVADWDSKAGKGETTNKEKRNG